MVVYLDMVIILNFLVDFLLLLAANRLAGYPQGTKRAALGAGVGAAYAAACVLPGFHFLEGNFWRIVSLGLVAWTAYGWEKSAWKRGGIFLLLSMALGGIAVGFNSSSLGVLALSGGALWGLCRFGFGGQVGGREYIPVEIPLEGEAVCFTALRDTGNLLQDPLTGEQVLVVDGSVAQKLTGLSREQLRHPMETMLESQGKGFRLIPYRAVGVPGGMLLGKRFSQVKFGKLQRSAVIAFAPEGLDGKGMYQALTGGVV